MTWMAVNLRLSATDQDMGEAVVQLASGSGPERHLLRRKRMSTVRGTAEVIGAGSKRREYPSRKFP